MRIFSAHTIVVLVLHFNNFLFTHSIHDNIHWSNFFFLTLDIKIIFFFLLLNEIFKAKTKNKLNYWVKKYYTFKIIHLNRAIFIILIIFLHSTDFVWLKFSIKHVIDLYTINKHWRYMELFIQVQNVNLHPIYIF